MCDYDGCFQKLVAVAGLAGIMLMAVSCLGCSSAEAEASRGMSFECKEIGTIVEAQFAHAHDLSIDVSDARAEEERLYTVSNGEHDHELQLTGMDFVQIKRGNVVQRVTDRTDGHTHPLSVGCRY